MYKFEEIDIFVYFRGWDLEQYVLYCFSKIKITFEYTADSVSIGIVSQITWAFFSTPFIVVVLMVVQDLLPVALKFDTNLFHSICTTSIAYFRKIRKIQKVGNLIQANAFLWSSVDVIEIINYEVFQRWDKTLMTFF